MEQNNSGFTERRRHPRINASNVVQYALFDEHKQKIDQGKGRTVDLSQKGTLLETEKPLHGSFIVLMTIDLDGEKVQVKGTVANTRKSDQTGLYLTGVEFIGSQDRQLKAIIALVKTYHHKKHTSQKNQSAV